LPPVGSLPRADPDLVVPPNRAGGGRGALSELPYRSVYPAQVRQIAPRELRDRDEELEELAAFCTEPGRGPYAWWQAPAFAGKTALMSWFALHPPPGVRVVSFFITARYRPQDNRDAFVEAVLDQLAELLGEPRPDDPRKASREMRMVHMLGEAEERVAAAGSGERLVLLVDGLDEDRSLTAGPDAYSIANLLPEPISDWLRVIVSGRPSLPVPVDVPDHHPLRDSSIVRPLAQSRHAAAARDLMQRELKHLLHGNQTEQDVLGLLAAAGGGLSAADLAELSGVPGYEIEELLTTVAARSFTARESVWRYGVAPQVYVFGHEELRAAATRFLRPDLLAASREKLYIWAADYRRRGWPEETPEYLLRGYFSLLQELDDVDRLIACATDWGRQDRLVQLSGGSGAALGEITAAQERLLRSAESDLPAMARLAAHHAVLVGRQAAVPDVLPQVWAKLGYWDRAAASADAMPSPDDRAQALTGLAETAASAGDRAWARVLAIKAETAALAVTDPEERVPVLTAIARIAADVGDLDRARTLADQGETAAHAITDPERKTRALAALVLAATDRGDLDRAKALAGDAETAASAIADLDDRSQLLADLAVEAAALGEHWWSDALWKQARTAAAAISDEDAKLPRLNSRDMTLSRLADIAADALHLDQAAELARSIGDPVDRTRQLAGLAVAAADAHNPKLASTLLGDAEAAANAAARYRVGLLGLVAGATARAGDSARARAIAVQAETTALAVPNPGDQAHELHLAVEAWVVVGDLARAETLIGSFTDPDARDSGFIFLAYAAAQAGDLKRAANAARSITRDLFRRARTLAEAASAAARAGDHDLAASLADEAATTSRTISDPAEQAGALLELTFEMARALDLDRAEAAARAIATPYQYTLALARTAEGAAQAGESGKARALVSDAVTAVASIADPADRAFALTRTAQAAAVSGDRHQAIALAAAAAAVPISDLHASSDRRLHLFWLAESASQDGDFDGAEMAARSIADSGDQARVLAAVVTAALKSGDLDRAETMTQAIGDPGQQARALIAMANAATQAGDLDRAERTARMISPEALADVARAAARSGDTDRAVAIARTITDPASQARALTWAAQAAVEAGDRRRAETLAAKAQAALRPPGGGPRHALTVDSNEHEQDLGLLADAAVRAGDTERTEALRRAAKLRAIARLLHGALDEPATDRRPAFWRPSFTPPPPVTPAPDRDLPAGWQPATGEDRDSGDDAAEPVNELARTHSQDRAAQGAQPETPSPASSCEGHAIAAKDFEREPGHAPNASEPEETGQLPQTAMEAIEAGDIGQARALLRRAEAAAESITGLKDRATTMSELVLAYALLGDMERGRALLGQFEPIAQSVADKEEQALIAVMGSYAAAALGDIDQAEAFIRSAWEPDDLTTAFVMLAELMAEMAESAHIPGSLDRAITARAYCIEIMARAQTAATSIAHLKERAKALTEVARAASTLAEAVDAHDPDHATALRERAESAALSIPDPEERAATLIDLAEAADDAGDADRADSARAHAVTAAEAITRPDGQAEALARLTTSAPGVQARTLLARALAAAHWKTSLSALEQISPEAVGAIADEYLAAQAMLPPIE
jgi:hypothetical protein